VKYTTIACTVSAIVNVPVSIVLAKNFHLGLNGVMLGSIVGLVITTTVYIYTTIKEINKMKE
jgi:Na+-driven multidrug efflux pump